jgi:hypothetical protein
MARVAFALGTADGRASVLDGLPGGLLGTGDRPSADSALCSPGAGPVLPGPAPSSWETLPDENPQAEPELNHIWLELSAPDRQRFGHCFSFMVLKALGLRPCPTEEVQA